MAIRKILVVDDFSCWRKEIRSILESIPGVMVVGEACDGADAVAMAEALRPELITLDVGLPTLNGIDAAIQIFEVSPRSKILFVSQNNDPEVILAALSTGASGYVLKENVATELAPAIKDIRQSNTFVSRESSNDVPSVSCEMSTMAHP